MLNTLTHHKNEVNKDYWIAASHKKVLLGYGYENENKSAIALVDVIK
jgi:hypothetical protein